MRYNNDEHQVHTDHIPNLNMHGDTLNKKYGGIPLPPPSSTSPPHQKEKIIGYNYFWTFVAIDPIFRPQSNN